MKLIAFHTKHGSFHQGALLDDQTLLDFDSPTSGLERPAAANGWLDTAGPHHKSARALWSKLCGDSEESGRLREQGAVRAVADVCLAAPVPQPGKFFCIGLNYRDHAEESGMDIPERPLIFSKFPSCVVGPGANVVLPPTSKEVDYEAELGIVIGRRASRVSADQALEHVLGYVCINDVSARDFQFADGQWQRGKSCDTFAPMGPWVVTRDSVKDPEQLAIRFRLNGETLQDSSTNQLIFGVAAVVADLSRWFTLEPGDVIATGTPPGVGFARKPPIYIKDGDRMEVDIEGLGVLENPVVAAADA